MRVASSGQHAQSLVQDDTRGRVEHRERRAAAVLVLREVRAVTLRVARGSEPTSGIRLVQMTWSGVRGPLTRRFEQRRVADEPCDVVVRAAPDHQRLAGQGAQLRTEPGQLDRVDVRERCSRRGHDRAPRARGGEPRRRRPGGHGSRAPDAGSRPARRRRAEHNQADGCVVRLLLPGRLARSHEIRAGHGVGDDDDTVPEHPAHARLAVLGVGQRKDRVGVRVQHRGAWEQSVHQGLDRRVGGVGDDQRATQLVEQGQVADLRGWQQRTSRSSRSAANPSGPIVARSRPLPLTKRTVHVPAGDVAARPS